MNIPALIKRIAAAGFAIVVKNGQPTLKRVRGDKPLPPGLLDEAKQNRDGLLRFCGGGDDPFHNGPLPAGRTKASVPAEFVTCPECKAEVMPEQMLTDPRHQRCTTRCPYLGSTR